LAAGRLREVRKSWARDKEVEDAAATTSWRMSLAERVVGSIRRSFVKAVEGELLECRGWRVLGNGWGELVEMGGITFCYASSC
jgi:hypothetical protein